MFAVPNMAVFCSSLTFRIIIIIIIIIISFMQGIYAYIPETNCVSMEYSVAAILLLLFMVLLSLVSLLTLLYSYINTFGSMCAVPNMAVFCCSLTSCFPGMLLTYFLNDFEMVPAAPIITGRRDLYLTTHNTHNTQTSIPPVGFEPTVSAGERPLTNVLDRVAIGTDGAANN